MKYLFFLLTSLSLIAADIPPTTRSVTLEWDPNPANELVDEYVVYWKAGAVGAYSDAISVGTNTSATIHSLSKNVQYYFICTARRDGLESEPSNEVILPAGPLPPGRLRIKKVTTISEEILPASIPPGAPMSQFRRMPEATHTPAVPALLLPYEQPNVVVTNIPIIRPDTTYKLDYNDMRQINGLFDVPNPAKAYINLNGTLYELVPVK